MAELAKRRRFLQLSSAVVGAGLAGCVGGLGGGSDTVKVGAAVPTSGPFALLGQEALRGYEFFMDHADGQMSSRDVEIVERDTQSTPGPGMRAIRELVESEDVDAVVGPASSATGVNAARYFRDTAQVPFLPSFVASTTPRENPDYCNRYTFYPWVSFRQMSIPTSRMITEELGGRSVDTSQAHLIALDYEAGHSVRDILTPLLEENGTEVVETTLFPPNVNDFAPYFPEIEESSADVVTGWLPTGPQSSQFIQQSANFGLKDEKTFCLNGDAIAPLTRVQAGEAADGWYGTHWYRTERDSELNNEFREWYGSNYDDLIPNSIAANGFNAMNSLAGGVESAGTTAADDLVEAMEGMSFGSPMGELTYRETDHQTEHNMFGFEIAGGQPDPIADYPGVVGPSKCDVS